MLQREKCLRDETTARRGYKRRYVASIQHHHHRLSPSLLPSLPIPPLTTGRQYYYANSHTRCICRPSTHNHTHIKHHVSRTEATESIFTRQESACSPLNKAGQVGSGEDLSANLEFYGVAFRGCLRRNQ